MRSRTVSHITLMINRDEQDTVDLIGDACEKALQLAQEIWGLEPPEDCRIHVMTSWLGFVFQSAPWPWRILLGATIPFWVFRVRRTWPYSAAWTQRYGSKVAIGVKPPRLLEQSGIEYHDSIGVRMFADEKDMRVNVQSVTCHELVHACSAHLRLPAWLNEGIATVTVDRFLGRPTIRQETLEFMRDFQPKAPPLSYKKLSRKGMDAIAYHGIRGYWLVRYMEDEHPCFLRHMFLSYQDAHTIEHEVALQLGMMPESFWDEIDELVTDHFEGQR